MIAFDVLIHAPRVRYDATINVICRMWWMFVSTHTPRTEAACSLRLHLQMIGHFDSRTRVGCDGWCDCRSRNFDSRIRAECNHQPLRPATLFCRFNSRTRVGATTCMLLSIRAPAQGATFLSSAAARTPHVLIRAPV